MPEGDTAELVSKIIVDYDPALQATTAGEEERNRIIEEKAEELRHKFEEGELQDFLRFREVQASKLESEKKRIEDLKELNREMWKDEEQNHERFLENKRAIESRERDVLEAERAISTEKGADETTQALSRSANQIPRILGALGIAGVGFGMMEIISSLREQVDELRTLRQSLLTVGALAVGGGGPLGSQEERLQISERIQDLIGRQVLGRESEGIAIAGALGRGAGFTPGQVGELIEPAALFGRRTGEDPTQIAAFFALMRREFSMSTQEITSAFATLVDDAEEAGQALKIHRDMTTQLAQQTRIYGVSLFDASELVKRFKEDLDEGRISIRDLVNLVSTARIQPGQRAFMAQQVLGATIEEARAGGFEELQRVLRERGGGDPLTQQRLIRQIAEGGEFGVAPHEAEAARAFTLDQMVQRFGDLPPEQMAARRRPLAEALQIISPDVPISMEQKLFDTLREGVQSLASATDRVAGVQQDRADQIMGEGQIISDAGKTFSRELGIARRDFFRSVVGAGRIFGAFVTGGREAGERAEEEVAAGLTTGEAGLLRSPETPGGLLGGFTPPRGAPPEVSLPEGGEGQTVIPLTINATIVADTEEEAIDGAVKVIRKGLEDKVRNRRPD